MNDKIILVYLDNNNNIERVGLYKGLSNPKWVKWLSKKTYKAYAKMNNIDVVEIIMGR